MRAERRLIIAASVVILALASLSLFVAAAQESNERLAHSNGQGTLRVGDDKFKINSVIVKLIPDHKAELTLVSDITIFLTATWSNSTQSQYEFDLDMTHTDSRGGLEGIGKVILKDDGKSVASLKLKGISRATKRQVEANFQGK